MTQRAELQVGKLFRDLDGSIVHLKSIRNDICIWTAEGHASDGSVAGATHVDNFRARFNPVPEPAALRDVPLELVGFATESEFAMVWNRFAQVSNQAGLHA